MKQRQAGRADHRQVGAYLPPGRIHDGKLIRRSVIYYNINAEVSSQSKYPEAAYLFLQWLSSTRTFSWMAGNPAGYFDPFQKANFAEPLVIETYHDYLVPVIQETIARSAPTLELRRPDGAGYRARRGAAGDAHRPEVAGGGDEGRGEASGARSSAQGRGPHDRRHQGQPRRLADDRRQGVS